MRVRSGHIVFDKKIEYKDLAPVYRELFLKFLRDSDQVPEDEEYMNMLVRENLMDLENNRKPEGYNRMGSMRLIFPIVEENVSFYIYSSMKNAGASVRRVVEGVSKFLRDRGFEHELLWDKMLASEDREQGF